MADEENKNTGQQSQSANKGGNAQNAGGSSNANKKRRRRPRKRKPSTNNVNSSNQIQNMAGGKDENVQKQSQPKKRTRHRPKHRQPRNSNPNANAKQPEPVQPEAVEAAVAPIEPMAPEKAAPEETEHGLTIEPLGNKPIQNKDQQSAPVADSQEDDGGFDLINIAGNDTSLEEEVPEEEVFEEEAPLDESSAPEEEFTLDDEVSAVEEEPTIDEEFNLDEDAAPVEEALTPEIVEPEDIPEPILPTEPSEAPSDWSQLKEAIKEDHVATEQKMKEGPVEPEIDTPPPADIPPEAIPAAAAAGAAMGAAVAAEEPKEPKEEPEPQLEPEPEVIKPSSLPEDELEKKEVIQIITRYVLGGCAVIAIISALFFFRLPQIVFGGITGLFSGGDAQQEEVMQDDNLQDNQTQTDKTKELESTFVAGDNQGTSRDKFEEGVETALLTGDGSPAYEGAPDAIKTLYQTGLETTSPIYTNRIGTYMAVLLKLQNSFSTDIHQLLDNSKDRAKAVDVHLRELREIYQDSIDTRVQLNEEKDRLKVQFNEVTTQKEKLEQDFFVSLEKLEGNKSNDLLNSFIETSKRQIELKSEYNALSKAAKLFDTAIANMDARIKDIELNRNALIKGVKVVDIKGSDLDLIIQEGDLF
jgi:hypothetical protein